MNCKIEIYKGDITQLKIDAIVNAANTSLLGGGGVDGAIHRAAGPDLLNDCRLLNGCRTGDAKPTKGFLLPARFVIHTVGPVWRGGNANEEALLASCYQKSLQIASDYLLESIAFPNISTGVYDFPKVRAAEIAIQTVKNFVEKSSQIKKVFFAVFDDENFEIYSKLL